MPQVDCYFQPERREIKVQRIGKKIPGVRMKMPEVKTRMLGVKTRIPGIKSPRMPGEKTKSQRRDY